MRVLGKIWETWKQIGRFIGDQVGRVFLTLFYFTLFMPFAVGLMLRGDPLTIRRHWRAHWLERTTRDLTLRDSRRLY
jgi:hypothetical protein